MSDDHPQTLDELTDEDLFRRYGRRGDLEAFEELVRRHEKGLYNFILRSVRDEQTARELMQETFVSVVRAAPDWEQRAKFRTWMYTIARNKCIDSLRKMRPELTLDEPRGGDDQRTPLEGLADEEDLGSDAELTRRRFQQALSRALDELPEEQRQTFMLKEVSGMKFREIADVMDTKTGTAKSRMRLAIDRLQVALADFADVSFER
jgi:RNA polymerase sigma-70 factor (ECF subfamily)